MSENTSFNIIRKAQFTPEQTQALKHFAHNIYDTIYFDLYVADFPSGQLAEDADDASSTFEWHWLKRVTEPVLVGYAFANPDANTDDLRNALREVGFQFSQTMGWAQQEDYDDVERLASEAFDQLFAQIAGETA